MGRIRNRDLAPLATPQKLGVPCVCLRCGQSARMNKTGRHTPKVGNHCGGRLEPIVTPSSPPPVIFPFVKDRGVEPEILALRRFLAES